MKNNKLAIILGALLMIVFAISPAVSAQDYAGAEIELTIEGTIDWALAQDENNTGNALFNGAGNSDGDWIALGLGRYYGLNSSTYADEYDSYLEAASTYITERYDDLGGMMDSNKPTDYHRIILSIGAVGGIDAPLAIGTYDGNPVNLVADGIYDCVIPAGLWKQGINSAIFALIALDAGTYEVPETATYTRTIIINRILALQCDDGGFALSGSVADVDITAMVIQALAPYYNSDTVYSNNKTVRQVVDKALSCLSTLQQSDGGFISWGTSNSESISQVIVALCSLGIDPENDTRFISSSGKTAIDALMSFQNEDGGFNHTISSTQESSSNWMATDQSRYALVSYWRYLNNMRNLYDFAEETNQSAWIFNLDNQESKLSFTSDTMTYGLKNIIDNKNMIAFTNIPAGPYDTVELKDGNGNALLQGTEYSINDLQDEIVVTIVRRDNTEDIYTLSFTEESLPEITFTDVPEYAWYQGYVYDLVAKGIINGKTATTFAPNDDITRAEFAKILAAASGEDLSSYGGNSTFGDVKAGAWYVTYINWAYAKGIVNGKSATAFAPNDNITRQEMAVMIGRYAASYNITLPETETPITFADAASIADWARDAVSAMQKAGIINGKPGNLFDPNGNAERCEAAKMVSIFLTIH